jgi:predicted transcriptional regulator of viral defense system
MRLQNFFLKHPVFTLNEFQHFVNAKNLRSNNTLKALLGYHRRMGHVIHIKRGLYAVVPLGEKAKNFPVDPYLVTAKLTPDAVLSHHTALAFYGQTYSVVNRFIYSTHQDTKKLNFQNCEYQGVLFPKRLRDTGRERFLVKQEDRLGMTVFVTHFERTLVDILDRPDLGLGWEEIWRSLESVGYFDVDKVLEYALLLNNATTIAKVGFYLEQHRESLRVEEQILQVLAKNIPKQPHYMDKNTQQPCQLQKRWNLIVPKAIIEQSWEEPL